MFHAIYLAIVTGRLKVGTGSRPSQSVKEAKEEFWPIVPPLVSLLWMNQRI